jgi:hypothetical protein
MKRDFTISAYQRLLDALTSSGYSFQRFDDFLGSPNDKVVILRHDVDQKPINSLLFANLQFERGIQSVFYFRAKKCSWNENIIKEIASLGHEIGYHYENLATSKGDMQKAILDFEGNLSNLRKLVPVSTICMHGSPLSRFDNREIWKHIDYKKYNIIGEPYFDLDFNNVLYLTDTGRSWNAAESSVRDKVESDFNYSFKSTYELISSVENDLLPRKIMINFHPQRWSQELVPWLVEKYGQQAKNPLKRLIRVIRS